MDYREIGLVSRGALDPGKLKVQADGIHFKSSKTNKVIHIKEGDIESGEWLRAARGYEMKVLMQDGVAKFDGFKESDFGDLRSFFRSQFHKELKEVELCVKGWNWGEVKFRGSLLSFCVDAKPAFEIPLREVSQVIAGKNEVTLEFHQGENTPVSMVEMRFHIPNTDGEEDPVTVFREKVLAHADIMQATGDAIVTFSEIQSLTPRGRYTIKAYPTFLQLHGKTFDYKIPYNTITRLFLLPHNDQRQMFFVLGLDPPIRQGQTRYYFVIFLIPVEDYCEVSLTLTKEEIEEHYEGKLKQEMSGTLYEVFSRVMRVLVGKKITVPGSFKTNNNLDAISCSNRATNGFLYPLDKGFIFVHKPTIYIKFEGIASVNFGRISGGAGVSRYFDFDVELKDGNVHHFSSMMKEDYGRLYQFVCDKQLRIKNKGKVEVVTYDDEGSSDSEHDAYRARMIAEGEEKDSEDEDSDFVAGESGSEDDLEFDSAAQSEGESGEEEEEPKAKRQKMESKPAKRKREEKKTEKRVKGSKKQKKDPNAPKKPLTAYMVWLGESRPALKAKYPGLSITDLSKKAGELWKTLDDKSKWTEEAERLKRRYKEEMAEYQKTGATSTAATKSRSKTSAKSPTKTPAKSPTKKGRGNEKYKSAEFVEDESSDEEDASEAGSPPEKKGLGSARSMRSGKEEENLVSLPSSGEEEESEGEAELTSDEESESD